MLYEIKRNEQYGSLEIEFSEKPGEAVRDALKALKFRWNGNKGVWYGFAEESEIKAVLEGEKAPSVAEAKSKETKQKAPGFDKEALKAEYAKAYDNSEKWLKYFMDKTATVAILPSGEMLPIDKQSIETHFCFGESGYDAEDAAHMAHVARTNENYFKEENMKSFDEIISLLKGNDTRELWLTICKDKGWGNKHPDSKLVRIKFMRLCEILDALGGSCFLEELPGKEFTLWNDSYRVATKEETECILVAYEQARASHEKKVDAYLKRYGTSKVHSWTYWRDA